MTRNFFLLIDDLHRILLEENAFLNKNSSAFSDHYVASKQEVLEAIDRLLKTGFNLNHREPAVREELKKKVQQILLLEQENTTLYEDRCGTLEPVHTVWSAVRGLYDDTCEGPTTVLTQGP